MEYYLHFTKVLSLNNLGQYFTISVVGYSEFIFLSDLTI